MRSTYIVLAHYSGKNGGSMVLGHFKTYKKALKSITDMQDCKNILGESVFSGGAVYSVPKKPHTKEDFKYTWVGE